MSMYFLVLLFCGLTLAEVCPPADKLSPCSCDENKRTITCSGVRGRFDIKAVFDRVEPLIPDSTVFDKLEIISCSSLLEIPENAIQTLKFVAIDLTMNENLEYIHPNAFNATYAVTKSLNFWNDFISNDSPHERDIYDLFNKFKNVESIWVPNNQLTSVPEDAFESLPYLFDLYLGNNNIKSIGNYAFAKLPNLNKLYMSFNQISSNGISEYAFKSVDNSLVVDLTSNNIQYLEESSFKTLIESALSVSVGGTYCSMSGCTYAHLICDSRADWICKDVQKYQNKLKGFLCYQNFDNIWDYCKSKSF